MKRKLGLAAALVLVAAAAFFVVHRGRAKADDGFRSGVFEPPREAPEFELEGSNGAKVHLRDYAGKVVILEFGFTYCTQVCPVTLANLTQAFKKLGPAAADVQLVFVTVDPKRDNPARLHEYLGAFNPSFVGATGAPDDLEAMRRSYGIIAKEVVFPNNQSGYDHSSFIYLVDRHGKIRTLVPFGKPPDDIVHDIQILLRS